MSDKTTQSLYIGLSSWIIQDGNYPDFSVDQQVKFALEFQHENLRTTEPGSKTAEHIAEHRYRIRGQVAFTNPDVWIIDVGQFLAYQNARPPSGIESGTWIESQIQLGVDPYFYFEYLHKTPGMPLLQYEFIVRSIAMETTPWIEIKDGYGRAISMRDENRVSFRQVSATNAWEDDDGRADYLLECALLGGPMSA